MENGWMINLTETPLDGHTPDLTITPFWLPLAEISPHHRTNTPQATMPVFQEPASASLP